MTNGVPAVLVKCLAKKVYLLECYQTVMTRASGGLPGSLVHVVA